MDADLLRLAALVQRSSGVVVRDGQLASLRSALARVDPQLKPADVLRRRDPSLLERLVDEVAIKETFFLRHLEELEAIDWVGMRARAAGAGRRLRIWSVACSTGEEVYSLGLLATEALGLDPPVDILGTDLSAPTLVSAEQGFYRARSMRLVDRDRRRRWFVQDGERLRVGRELRRLARFARHNLVLDPYPPDGEPPFDLIVCRNILIYFDGPTVARVATALPDALAPGGRLLLGTVDRLGGAPVPVPPPVPRPFRPASRRPDRTAAPRRLHPGAASRESAPEAAHAAFEAGSRALHAGDPDAAVRALRRALYLDPKRAVVALLLARAHEALHQTEAARRAYWRALRLVDEAPGQETLLYDRIAAGDVVAACRARLAVLAEGALSGRM